MKYCYESFLSGNNRENVYPYSCKIDLNGSETQDNDNEKKRRSATFQVVQLCFAPEKCKKGILTAYHRQSQSPGMRVCPIHSFPLPFLSPGQSFDISRFFQTQWEEHFCLPINKKWLLSVGALKRNPPR